MPKRTVNIKDFSGGYVSFLDSRDIQDNESSESTGVAFHKSGIIKMIGEAVDYSSTIPDLAGFWQGSHTTFGVSEAYLSSGNVWVDSMYNHPGVGLFSFSSKYKDADTATSVAGTTEGSNLISTRKYLHGYNGGSLPEGHADSDWASSGNFRQNAARYREFWHHYINTSNAADNASYINLPGLGAAKRTQQYNTTDYPSGCRFDQNKIFCDSAEGRAKYESKRYLLTFSIHHHNRVSDYNKDTWDDFKVLDATGAHVDIDNTESEQLAALNLMHDTNSDGSGEFRQYRLKKIIIKGSSSHANSFVNGSDIVFYSPVWNNNGGSLLTGDHPLIPNTFFAKLGSASTGQMYSNGLAGQYCCIVTSVADLDNGGAGRDLRIQVDVDSGDQRYMHDDNATRSTMDDWVDHTGTGYGVDGTSASNNACESFFLGNIGLYKIAEPATTSANYLFMINHGANKNSAYTAEEHNGYNIDHQFTHIHTWDDSSGIWDRYSSPWLDSLGAMDEHAYAPHMNSRNYDPRSFKVNGALWFYNLGHRSGYNFGNGTMKLAPTEISGFFPNGGSQFNVDEDDRIWQFSCANGNAGNVFPSRTAVTTSEHGSQGGALSAPETGVRYAADYYDPGVFAQDAGLRDDHLQSSHEYSYQFIRGCEVIARSLGNDNNKFVYDGAFPSNNVYFFYATTSLDPAAGGGWNALASGNGYRLWCSYYYEDDQESQLVDLDQNNQNGLAFSGNEVVGQRLYGRVRIPRYLINSYKNTHDRVRGGNIHSNEDWRTQGGARNNMFSLRGVKIYFSNEMEYPDSRFLLLDINFKKGVKHTGQDTDYSPWTPVTVNNKVVGYDSQFDVTDPPLFYTYEAMNGFGPTTSTSFSYSSAVIANRRLYASDGVTIRRSPVNQFSLLPENSTIEIVKDDGDPIMALHEFGDRLLVFKQKKVHIINVSDEIDFLEETINYMGINNFYHVTTIDYGVVWFNENGVYHFNGEKIRNLMEKENRKLIDLVEWQAFLTTSTQIMYDPDNRDILIKEGVDDSEGQFYIFNVTTQSWTKTHETDSFVALTDHGKTSNWVLDHNNKLIVAHDTTVTDKYKTLKFVYWSKTRASSNTITYATKDFDFNQPGVKKKLCKVYVSYKGNGSSLAVKYSCNGETDTADMKQFNSDNTPLEDKSGDLTQWHIAELKPTVSSEANNKYSFRIHMTGSVNATFEINDITLVYRMKSVK